MRTLASSVCSVVANLRDIPVPSVTSQGVDLQDCVPAQFLKSRSSRKKTNKKKTGEVNVVLGKLL